MTCNLKTVCYDLCYRPWCQITIAVYPYHKRSLANTYMTRLLIPNKILSMSIDFINNNTHYEWEEPGDPTSTLSSSNCGWTSKGWYPEEAFSQESLYIRKTI